MIEEVLERVRLILEKNDIAPCTATEHLDSVSFTDQATHDQYVLKLIKCEE